MSTTTNTTPIADAIKMLTVSTVPAALVPTGSVQIIARTRASTDKATGKKTEIAADQRSRSILIPEFTPNVSSKYTRFVCDALEAAAQAQLSEQWKQDPAIKEVPAALYTEESVLAYWAREAESKKLNSTAILAWWNQSQLCKDYTAKYTAAQLARFVKSLENIAAPVPSSEFYNEEKALKRIVTLATYEQDAEQEVCKQMIAKLQNFVLKSQQMRASLGDVEEIPE